MALVDGEGCAWEENRVVKSPLLRQGCRKFYGGPQIMQK